MSDIRCVVCGELLDFDTCEEGRAIPSPAGDRYHNPDYVCYDCLSKVEDEEANRVWLGCYSDAERIKYMRQHASQFDCLYVSYKPDCTETRPLAARWRDILANARGRYFSGYASELIG
jgi:hypothetical protein